MISTHILDTQKGLPAQGVEASLYIKKEGNGNRFLPPKLMMMDAFNLNVNI